MKRAGLLLVACAVLAFGILGPSAAIFALAHQGGQFQSGEAASLPSGRALGEIPPTYLRLYEAAARRYRIEWEVLAGIGKVECDHGQDPSPSCTREGAVNSAGAGGPMQFLAATFAQYGVAPYGGKPDRWNPADAIFSAARYLAASGAPGNYRKAIFAYNHASWYVAEVLAWARRYRGRNGARVLTSGRVAPDATATRVEYVRGSRARLDPSNGHIAMIPTDVPFAVQAMLVAGNELQNLPYGPQGHPDPLGAAAEDCSSTVNYVLYRAGIRSLTEIVHENPLAQDYVRWGLPGPGRWVTIYAADVPTPHVFIVIAGLRLDTVRLGSDIGPNREQDGPRWRIYPNLPAWARWTVRHPPGL